MTGIPPAGHVQLDSGLIVRRETLALDSFQDPPVRVSKKGTTKSESRGFDVWSKSDKRRSEAIETARRRDAIVSRGVQYYVMLSIGNGLSLAVSDAGTGSDSGEGKAALDFAETFWDANEFEDNQYVLATELTAQGDLYVYMPKPKGGGNEFIPGMQFIPAGQIHRIATEDGRPIYYTRRWHDREYGEPVTERKQATRSKDERLKLYEQDIMAEEMVHFAMNRGAQDLRGVSMFEAAIYWSTLYHRVLDTVWAYSVARSMFATHWKVPGNQTTVEALKDKIESDILVWREDATGQKYKSTAPGQSVVTGKEVEIVQLQASMTAGSLDSEMRRILLMAATALGLPEFTLSDGNYSNLASSESQNAPFFRLLQAHQQMIIRAHRRILRKAFDWMQAAGKMKGLKPPEGKRHVVDWIDILAPDVLSPNISALAASLTSAVNAGWMSRQQAAQMVGLDWEDTMKQRLDEKAKGLETKPQGLFGAPDFPQTTEDAQEQLSKFMAAYSGGRDETQGVAGKVEGAGAKALKQFAKDLLQTKGDRDAMLKAYIKCQNLLKDDLLKGIDKGAKVGAESIAA